MKRGWLKTRGKRGGMFKVMDALLRKIILKRDVHCQWCEAGKDGSRAVLQVAHIKPKGTYSSLRYELENVILLCRTCHLFKWHKDPLAAAQWLESARPGLMARLTFLAQTRKRVNRKAERVMLERLAA